MAHQPYSKRPPQPVTIGATARSVKRRKGMTRYEWDQLEGNER